MFDRYKLKRAPKIQITSKNVKNRKPITVKVKPKIRNKNKNMKV